MTDILIMAAGLGTRMKSRKAKVLHELAGRPLITHVLDSAVEVQPDRILIVVGHQADEVERAVREHFEKRGWANRIPEPCFVLQNEQRGTGHAVMAAESLLTERSGSLMVLAGDGPMITAGTLQKLGGYHGSEGNDLTMLTVHLDDPSGYGRIVRDAGGAFLRCVEAKDATPDQIEIKEVAVSIYCFEIGPLLAALKDLGTDNVQAEYYLTDVPRIMIEQGLRVGVLLHDHAREVLGVNNRVELARMEKEIRNAKVREVMLGGVTVLDPASTYIHPEVEIGPDTTLHPQVVIEGGSRIGSDCTIYSWTRLRNVSIGDGVTIRNSTLIEDCTIRDGATVGPFARLRMGAEIGENAGIGNFVEVKKSRIGRGTKASHLTYLGDATIGNRVNIGAGTVTCNYDGVTKHETVIEDEVKIGSDTMLVAPVRVGRGAVTGAGAVVTQDIPPGSLAVGVPAVVKKKIKKV